MKIDKWYHLYGRKDDIVFEEVEKPERKSGEWVPQDHNKRTGYVTTTVYYYPKCSECGHTGNYGMNFCPNCGAKMENAEA